MSTAARTRPDTRPVPLVDLGLQHRRVADDVAAGFARVLADTAFVLGPEVERFEAAFAAYCQVPHCVGVANGTDAVELALRALGIGRGDEVVVPANTFVATAGAVLRAGAELVLADCDEDFLLSSAAVQEALSGRTRAVVPVHLFGQAAPVQEIRAALPAGVSVVEDAAQAQGARRHGRAVGSLGDAAATSFYPGKNLGAYGDAGAVLTSSAETAESLRALRNHGGTRKYEHDVVGVNSRLDAVQAAVLNAKLPHLDAWNGERVQAARRYEELLVDLSEVQLPRTLQGNEHVWHLFVVRVPRRDAVLAEITRRGIGAGVHYPTPVHLLPAFAHLGLGAGSFPVAERASREILSLPLFPGITVEQQERVSDALRHALRRPDRP